MATKVRRAAKSAFHHKTIRNWSEFTSVVSNLSGEWIFRGQTHDWPLTSSLERAIADWRIDLRQGSKIENQIIRDFLRRYRGDSETYVNSDTLQCLALMQHHGAPTRLIDFTYSPFVAAKFAIESGAKEAVLWCLKSRWCSEEAGKMFGRDIVRDRNIDGKRGDTTFKPLYMDEKATRKFVLCENPVRLDQRLVLQQGVFLCPGDINCTFEENVRAMKGWWLSTNLFKLRLLLSKRQAIEFATMIRRMNISSAVLFPGLDGFARSYKESVFWYAQMAKWNTGSLNHIHP